MTIIVMLSQNLMLFIRSYTYISVLTLANILSIGYTHRQYTVIIIPNLHCIICCIIHLKTCSASFANESVRRLLGVLTRRSRFAEVTFPWTRHGILGRNVPAAIPSCPEGGGGGERERVEERGRRKVREGRKGKKEEWERGRESEIKREREREKNERERGGRRQGGKGGS